MSGVPSRQSSPRTCRVAPSIATSSTIEEAIGFGRTGERKAKVPVVCMELNGVCNTRSRRADDDRADGPSRLPRFGHSWRERHGV